MATRFVSWLVGACAAVTTIAGCSEAATPEPAVVTTVSPTGRPAISRPLDATRFTNKEKICELLTKEQADRIGVRDDDGDPLAISGRATHSCSHSYNDGSTISRVDIHIFPIDWLDEQHKPDADDEIVWLNISGQPAVAYRSSKAGSGCQVFIGLAERQSAAVFVSEVSPHARDTCELAEKVGLEIVRNLS